MDSEQPEEKSTRKANTKFISFDTFICQVLQFGPVPESSIPEQTAKDYKKHCDTQLEFFEREFDDYKDTARRYDKKTCVDMAILESDEDWEIYIRAKEQLEHYGKLSDFYSAHAYLAECLKAKLKIDALKDNSIIKHHSTKKDTASIVSLRKWYMSTFYNETPEALYSDTGRDIEKIKFRTRRELISSGSASPPENTNRQRNNLLRTIAVLLECLTLSQGSPPKLKYGGHLNASELAKLVFDLLAQSPEGAPFSLPYTLRTTQDTFSEAIKTDYIQNLEAWFEQILEFAEVVENELDSSADRK